MEQYQSITNEITNGKYHVFSKLDGQNIRAEYSLKSNSFVKFGMRHTMIDRNTEKTGIVVDILNEKFRCLMDVFKKHKLQKVTAFFEFYGPNSFCGIHSETDTLTCTLIDIKVYKKGYLLPSEYLDIVDESKCDSAYYHGCFGIGAEFIKLVRESKLENMAKEGVVCKGQPLKKGFPPHMFKIKSEAWLGELRKKCKTEEEFNKLA